MTAPQPPTTDRSALTATTFVEIVDTTAKFKVAGDKKILVETEGRLLWFLKTRRYPAVDGKEIREVKLRLLEVLLRDGLPDPRDVCLMSLAETCGIIRQIVPALSLASMHS